MLAYQLILLSNPFQPLVLVTKLAKKVLVTGPGYLFFCLYFVDLNLRNKYFIHFLYLHFFRKIETD